jgi:predicted NBD/HSP70 family sugar kinase
VRVGLKNSPSTSLPDPGTERGSNANGMRAFNERALLQALRDHGPTPQAQLARRSGLTAQTVAIIVRRLLDEGLVHKLPPVRGRVGQPAVPIALDPDGAFSIGIKIGRQSLDVLLMDFVGQTRGRRSLTYRFPDPKRIFDLIAEQIDDLSAQLPASQQKRICGVGVAAPFSLGSWESLLGMPESMARRWRNIDMAAEISQRSRLAVEVIKDTSAACVAELVQGEGRLLSSFVYVFVDTFVGGGLVLEGRWYGGLQGNAGAIGSMMMPGADRGSRGSRSSGSSRSSRSDRSSVANLGADNLRGSQLLGHASLLNLEQLYAAAGLPVSASLDERSMQSPWLAQTRRWLRQSAPGIALAIHNAACLLNLEGVIVDGSFGRELLQALLQALEHALDELDWQGVTRPVLRVGRIGSDARALGGAILPLYGRFAPDRNSFLKALV